MTAKITDKINTSSLDLIRVKILDILAVELSNQAELGDGDKDFEVNPILEQFTPMNIDQYPAINVRFVNASVIDQDIRGSKYSYTYWVEYYITNRGDESFAGHRIGALRLTKVLTACKFVLRHPEYLRLDLPAGIVAKVTPTTIQVSEQKYNQNSGDALDGMYGRLTVEVEAGEEYGSMQANLLSEHQTRIDLYDSDKGMEYITTVL